MFVCDHCCCWNIQKWSTHSAHNQQPPTFLPILPFIAIFPPHSTQTPILPIITTFLPHSFLDPPPQHHNTTPSCKQNIKQKTRITIPPLQSNTAPDRNPHSSLFFFQSFTSNQTQTEKQRREDIAGRGLGLWAEKRVHADSALCKRQWRRGGSPGRGGLSWQTRGWSGVACDSGAPGSGVSLA